MATREQRQRVACRLARDDGFRQRAAAAYRAAAAAPPDAGPLSRIRRLNEFLAEGLVLLDDEDRAGAPLPWEQAARAPTTAAAAAAPSPPAAPSCAAAAALQPPTAAAAPAPALSPEDSDIDDSGPGTDTASLLAALEASVQRRRAAAALAIQAAWRGRRARLLARRLRERRDAAERLVARALAAAYQGTIGPQRCLAQRTAMARIARWRRWRWRCRQRLHRQLREPGWQQGVEDPHAPESVEQQQSTAAGPAAGEQQAVLAVEAAAAPLLDPAEAVPPPQQRAQQLTVPLACCQQLLPAPSAAAAGAAPAAIPSAAEPPRVATPPTALIAASGPVPAGFLPPGSLLPRTASSGGGGGSRASSAGQQLAQQPSPRSGRLPPPQGGPPPRSAGAPGAGGAGGCGGGHRPYRRASSIQLLEAVQLGVDCAAGPVASQAAMAVCERAQEAARELRSAASCGRRPGTAGGGGAGCGHIGRVNSRVQRQGSRARGADPIAE